MWIRALPLFENLSDGQANRLQQRCRRNKYKPNSQVIDYDDNSLDVWFLLAGRARVQIRAENGKELVLCHMAPGDLFGEMAAIDHEPRSACITTLEDSELCVMHASDFILAATEFPPVAKTLLSTFAARIRAMNEQVRQHAFMSNRQRLGAELMRRAKPRAANPEQLIISPPPRHLDLADSLGMMREAITREMSTLRKLGLLENSTGGCIIPDPDAMNALISG